MYVLIERRKKGMTQVELAANVGISRQFLARIEKGDDSKVTKEIMIKIAKELDSTPHHLFFDEV